MSVERKRYCAQARGQLIHDLVRPMSAFSVIRGIAIGIAAVAVPTVAVAGIEVFYRSSPSLGIFVCSLSVLFVLVGGLAWACVRVAHFPPSLAILLTGLPFGVLVLITAWVSDLDKWLVAFLLLLVQLVLAVFVAWAATRLARRPVLLSARRFCYIVIGIVGMSAAANASLSEFYPFLFMRLIIAGMFITKSDLRRTYCTWLDEPSSTPISTVFP